jgi:hypothetical protein
MRRTLVLCQDVRVIRRLTQVLTDLALPYQVVSTDEKRFPQGPTGTAYCVDSVTAAEFTNLRGPTVVVLTGARVPDSIVRHTLSCRVSTVDLPALTPHTLLRAIVSASTGHDLNDLVQRLCDVALFRDVDRVIVTEFLKDPRALTRLTDLRRAGMLSREAAQTMVRAWGFRRAEHLFTALRVATWVMLCEMGLQRAQVEAYLGIDNRGSLRRACRRAGVPSLSRQLRMEMLLPRSTTE